MHTFDTQESFAEIAENVTPQVIESLSNSFVQTNSMESISRMDWPNDTTEFTYMSATLEVSLE